jgi:hypothetical protein
VPRRLEVASRQAKPLKARVRATSCHRQAHTNKLSQRAHVDVSTRRWVGFNCSCIMASLSWLPALRAFYISHSKPVNPWRVPPTPSFLANMYSQTGTTTMYTLPTPRPSRRPPCIPPRLAHNWYAHGPRPSQGSPHSPLTSVRNIVTHWNWLAEHHLTALESLQAELVAPSSAHRKHGLWQPPSTTTTSTGPECRHITSGSPMQLQAEVMPVWHTVPLGGTDIAARHVDE